MEAYPSESDSPLLEPDESLSVSDVSELAEELMEEGGVEGWRVREGVTGAGEPTSVGELAAIDECEVVIGWVGVFVSDAWSCRLRFRKCAASWLSMSSRARFLIVSIIERSDSSSE